MADYIVHKAVELSALSNKLRSEAESKSWIVSPKYDGCHAVFAFDNGKFVGAYSRTGETVLSMPHIARDLPEVYPDLKVNGRLAICGEAWILGEEFNVISGTFRRHTPQPQLQFVPFDVVPFDYNDTFSGPSIDLGYRDNIAYPAPYYKRIEALMKRASIPSQVLAPRYSIVEAPLEAAYALASATARRLKAMTDAAYDGTILADAHGRYVVGAGKGGEFIKCKPLLSETVTVTAVIADIGPKTSKNTCVLCFYLGGQLQKVSTGLTQAQADAWSADPHLIIDKSIEVEAMGLTVNGLLREPRFKGARTDII